MFSNNARDVKLLYMRKILLLTNYVKIRVHAMKYKEQNMQGELKIGEGRGEGGIPGSRLF